MAVDNFIPEIWSSLIVETLKKSLVFSVLTNRDYEGEISQAGDSVRINALGPVANAAYTKNVTNVVPATLNDQSQLLIIDHARYFCFEVDDVDKRQAKGDILAGGILEATYGLRDTADQFLAALWSGAASTSADTPVNSVNVLAAVLTAAENLNERNVPLEGRAMVVTPWFMTKLVIADVLLETGAGNAPFRNGWVGRCGGFDIHVSNNVAASGGFDKIMAGTSRGITYAEQLGPNQVEAFRPEGAFSDAVKGLHLYGGRVVRPDALTVLSVSEAAEP